MSSSNDENLISMNDDPPFQVQETMLEESSLGLLEDAEQLQLSEHSDGGETVFSFTSSSPLLDAVLESHKFASNTKFVNQDEDFKMVDHERMTKMKAVDYSKESLMTIWDSCHDDETDNNNEKGQGFSLDCLEPRPIDTNSSIVVDKYPLEHFFLKRPTDDVETYKKLFEKTLSDNTGNKEEESSSTRSQTSNEISVSRNLLAEAERKSNTLSFPVSSQLTMASSTPLTSFSNDNMKCGNNKHPFWSPVPVSAVQSMISKESSTPSYASSSSSSTSSSSSSSHTSHEKILSQKQDHSKSDYAAFIADKADGNNNDMLDECPIQPAFRNDEMPRTRNSPSSSACSFDSQPTFRNEEMSHTRNPSSCSASSFNAAATSSSGCSDESLGSNVHRFVHKELWNQKYQELVAYQKVFNHCLVPVCWARNPSLGNWVKRQRYQYRMKKSGKHSTMTDERQEALERLGFTWDNHAANWQERWNELQQFQEANGHVNVPKKYPQSPKLPIWIKCQRRQYKLYRQGNKKSHMTSERIEKLLSLGFNFDPQQQQQQQNRIQQQQQQKQKPLRKQKHQQNQKKPSPKTVQVLNITS